MGVWDILTWGCGVCRDPHPEHPHMGVWSNCILNKITFNGTISLIRALLPLSLSIMGVGLY